MARRLAWLNAPCDPRGLAVFRILFGALMAGATVRFWAYGWIEQIYIAPKFHFPYCGFEWVTPWPGDGMYVHYAVMGLAALGLMAGAFTRVSAGLFFACFTYAELIEKAAYLNHYYLVSLLAFLLIFVPSETVWSVDAWRKNTPPRPVPRWAYVLLRGQLAVVYVFAGLAKLNADWLFRAEPLRTWLSMHVDLPIVGPYLGLSVTAFAMSWAGMVYDLSIAGWLSWSKTRRYAFLVSIFFHGTIWLLFPVGVFSWVMLVGLTLFFPPEWPARLWATLRRRPVPNVTGAPVMPLTSLTLGFVAMYLAIQILVPLRFAVYPGHVNWTEEGFRFAWRVMLIEKTGQVEYEVVTGADDRRYHVYPRRELTMLQHRMLVTQPDMIHTYAQEIARRFRAEGHQRVRVFAHAWAALNGRPSQRMIDPTVDLAAVGCSWGAQPWIVDLSSPPPD